MKCAICKGEFVVEEKPGAILFGPPESIEPTSTVKKHHICRDCYQEIVG